MIRVGSYVRFKLGGLEYLGYIKEILKTGNLKIMFGEHYQIVCEIKKENLIWT